MAECYCHTSTTMHLARIEMRDYISFHKEEIENVSTMPLCVTCKNGDTHYFMSENQYEKWCRDRTYILKQSHYSVPSLDKYDERYRSSSPLKGE